MSNWTKEEVAELKPENGGSNANCQRLWLSGCSSSDRPRPGDPQEKVKAYIKRAYVDEAYKGRPAPITSSAPAHGPADSGAASPLRASKGPWGPVGHAALAPDPAPVVAQPAPPVPRQPAPAEPEVDLLGGFSSTFTAAVPSFDNSEGASPHNLHVR